MSSVFRQVNRENTIALTALPPRIRPCSDTTLGMDSPVQITGAIIVLATLDPGNPHADPALLVIFIKAASVPPGRILVIVMRPGNGPIIAFISTFAITGGTVFDRRHKKLNASDDITLRIDSLWFGRSTNNHQAAYDGRTCPE